MKKKMKKNIIKGDLLPFIMLPLVFEETDTPKTFAEKVAKEFEESAKNQVDKAALKTELETGFKTVIDTAVEKQVTEKTSSISGEMETLKTSLATAEGIAVKQGEAIEALKQGGGEQGNGLEVAKNLKTQLEDLQTKTLVGTVSEKVTIKVADTADTAIAIQDHNSIPGAIGAIGNYFAQLIPGIARKPVPTSNILDYVDVLPITADRMVSISQTETVSILVTAECAIKPKSNVVWSSIDAIAVAVATTFKTTTQMRRFFPMFVTSFMNTLKDYFTKKIPQLVLAEIRAHGTAFTAVPAQQTSTDPNKWDALIAVIASQIKLGYSPNIAKMSVFAWEDMVTKKASDGHYMLQNNGSINLLDKTVSFGNVKVAIEPDVELGDDELIVGDLYAAVKVGLDSNLTYMEYFSMDDGDKNLKSHLLEKFIALIMPTATRTGVTVDSFTNVIAAITLATP